MELSAGAALDRLCRLNVQQQLDNLKTYRSGNEQVDAGRLKLVGLYFDISSTQVHVVTSPVLDIPAEIVPLPTAAKVPMTTPRTTPR
jgi:carbonic anhydrase